MGETGHILLVDDSPEEIKTCSLLLERDGHSVSTASNLKDAKEIISKSQVDLILLDLHLNNESGTDLLTWLKQEPGELTPPALVITVSGEPNLTLDALHFGAETDVFGNIHPFKQCTMLENHPAFGMWAGNFMAIDVHVSGRLRQKTCKNV